MTTHTAEPKIYIGVPCFRSQVYTNHVLTLLGLGAAFARGDVEWSVQFVANASCSRGRNDIAAAFLKTDFTHLLFIDDDVGGLSVNDVSAIIGSGFAITALACPRRDPSGGFVVNPFPEHVHNGQSPIVEACGRRFIEVHDAGTGIMCIRREVLERMRAELASEISYVCDARTTEDGRGEVRHDFFAMMPDPSEPDRAKRRYLSEDYGFCRRWQQLGGKVHLLLDTEISHFGAHEFKARFPPAVETRTIGCDLG